MYDSKKGDIFAILGAISFILGAAILIYNQVKEVNSIDWFSWIGWCVYYVVFAILLLIKKKNVLFLVPPAIAVIIVMHNVITAIPDMALMDKFDIFTFILYVPLYVFLFILLMINVIPSMKSAGAIKGLCFIPAAMSFILFFNGCRNLIFVLKYDILLTFNIYLSDFFDSFGILFLGLWLNSTMLVSDNNVYLNSYASVNSPLVMSQTQQIVGDIDNINKRRIKMEKTQVMMWLQSNAKFFPEGRTLYLQERLENLSEQQFMQVSTLDFKDPTTMIIISVFLGGLGIDRFMLGETGMGVLKLLTGGCCGILWLIDLFTIGGKTKDYNFNKFSNALGVFGVGA